MLRIGNVLATGIFGLLVSFDDVLFVVYLFLSPNAYLYFYVFMNPRSAH